ncbi:BrnA antitoxin family protein [Labrys okinawensis]|uniref:BrnA antitoxin family protein n=1 Tax=Labrys okinawensis TaxID=346911 RepID=UPI0039BC97FD
MSSDRTRRPSDPWKQAEAAFKPKAAKAVAPPKKPAIPNAKEVVSLRLDRDLIEHYQAEGLGWQDRINAILREASGIDQAEGLRPDELNAEDDS